MKGMWILKVDKGGRVTLPKDLLEYTGWKVGDTLLFQGTGDGTILVSRVKRAKLKVPNDSDKLVVARTEGLNSRRLPSVNEEN